MRVGAKRRAAVAAPGKTMSPAPFFFPLFRSPIGATETRSASSLRSPVEAQRRSAVADLRPGPAVAGHGRNPRQLFDFQRKMGYSIPIQAPTAAGVAAGRWTTECNAGGDWSRAAGLSVFFGRAAGKGFCLSPDLGVYFPLRSESLVAAISGRARCTPCGRGEAMSFPNVPAIKGFRADRAPARFLACLIALVAALVIPAPAAPRQEDPNA